MGNNHGGELIFTFLRPLHLLCWSHFADSGKVGCYGFSSMIFFFVVSVPFLQADARSRSCALRYEQIS